jgi:hypothetical protein
MTTVSVTLQRSAKDILSLTGTVGISIAYWCETMENGHVKPHDDDRWFELDFARVPDLAFNPKGVKGLSNDTLNRLRSCFINDEDYIDPDGYTDDAIVQLAAFGEVIYG